MINPKIDIIAVTDVEVTRGNYQFLNIRAANLPFTIDLSPHVIQTLYIEFVKQGYINSSLHTTAKDMLIKRNIINPPTEKI